MLGFLYVPVVVSLMLSFEGCTPQTESVSLPVDTTTNFSASGVQEVPDRWWTVLDDQDLNVLVDSALSNNFNLKTAWQRLKAAQAIVDRKSSSFFPTLDATVEAEMSQYQTQFVQDQQLLLGLSSRYEVDLWGRIRSGVEAERYRKRATRSDYQTAALSLSAEIARTWYRLVEMQKQLELIRDQIETNEKVLRLLEARFGRGQIRSADILRQRQLLESTREQKISVETGIRVLKNQLAVLTGKSPQGADNLRTEDPPMRVREFQYSQFSILPVHWLPRCERHRFHPL